MEADSGSLVTLYSPALWRRVVRDWPRGFLAFLQVAYLDEARLLVLDELGQLALDLDGLVLERLRRVAVLVERHPRASNVGEVLTLEGYGDEDVGRQADFRQPWAPPLDLADARALLAWFRAHPSRLPAA